jgi:hypothetical protein
MTTAAPPASTDPSPDPGVDTLKLLFDAVVGAVKRAQVEVQSGAEKKLAWYFPVNPTTGKPEALMVKIPVPKADGTTEFKDIPLFALVPHHDIMIDQVSVRMKVSLLDLLSTGGKTDVRAKLAGPGTDPEFMAEVEVKMKGTEPVEGIARLNDLIVKRI